MAMAETATGLLAIFWDIENCAVPRGKSAVAVAQCIRRAFLNSNIKEAEFVCVCDVTRESNILISSLNEAQVTVVHVSNEHKNAADDKLKYCMRKFSDSHKAPVTLVLISADVDFATDLSHMRNYHKYHIILVHNKNSVKEALSITAHKVYSFDEIVRNAPEKEQTETWHEEEEVHLVQLTGLPINGDLSRVKAKLATLANNTKGQVIHCTKKNAIIKYGKSTRASRAAKRMNHQDLFGCKISAVHVTNACSTSDGFGSMMNGYLEDGRSGNGKEYGDPSLCSQADRYTTTADPAASGCFPSTSATRRALNLSPYQKSEHSYTADTSSEFLPSLADSPVHRRSPYNLRSRQHLATSTPVRKASTPTHTANSPRPIVKRTDDVVQRQLSIVTAECITLYVTNLNICQQLIERCCQALLDIFQRYGKVLNVEACTTADEALHMALVYVDVSYDVDRAVRENHCSKFGSDYLFVSRVLKSAEQLRADVVSLFDGVPQRCMPLFELLERFMQRFLHPICAYQLHMMSETVKVGEGADGVRMVCLVPLVQPTTTCQPPLQTTTACQSLVQPTTACQSPAQPIRTFQPLEPPPSPQLLSAHEMHVVGRPYCMTHCCRSQFTLIEERGMLPYVKVELDIFTQRVHSLLDQHSGEMHLMSFTFCYEAIYTKLVETADGGVPLEHLISCVSNVCIRVDSHGVKKLYHNREGDAATAPMTGCDSESFSSPNMDRAAFSREVINLLKRMPGCQMSYSKFIPSYHHHFGLDAMVTDFEEVNLLELFASMPQVIEVLGTGNQKVLFLTHNVQIKRFTTDLRKVLSAQPGRQCLVEHLAECFSKVMNTDLNIASYGVCYIKDLLDKLAGSDVIVQGTGGSAVVSIYRKEQTPEQVQRTIEFSYRAIKLLRRSPPLGMLYSRFIPAYHQLYGEQCRLADYGFSKLVELFDVISNLVHIKTYGDSLYISLTPTELYKVLSEKILKTLKASASNTLEVKQLGPAYQKATGHSLDIEEFGATSVEELIEKVPHISHVETRAGREIIVLNDKSRLVMLANRCLQIFMVKSNGCMKISVFVENYKDAYSDDVDMREVQKYMCPALEISDGEEGSVSLHPLLAVARRIMVMLQQRGKVNMGGFEEAYRRRFGVNFSNQECVYPTTVLFQILDSMLSLSNQKTLVLRLGYLARLSQEIAYKVGIYHELVKYNISQHNVGCDSIPPQDALLELQQGAAVNRKKSAGNLCTKVTKAEPLVAHSPPLQTFDLEQAGRDLRRLLLTDQPVGSAQH